MGTALNKLKPPEPDVAIGRVAAVRWAAEEMRAGAIVRGGERMCWYAELLTHVLAEVER